MCRAHDPAAPRVPARFLATANAPRCPTTVLVCRRVGRLTRSRKARDTQWTRDAVLNNPDLLRHIAEQTDLPTACKLLTTSKQNFVGGADFFDKQWIYYEKQHTEFRLEREQLVYKSYKHLPDEQLAYWPFAYEEKPVEYHILDNEATQVYQEAKVLQIRSVRPLKAYLELLCDYFGVKNTAFDKERTPLIYELYSESESEDQA